MTLKLAAQVFWVDESEKHDDDDVDGLKKCEMSLPFFRFQHEVPRINNKSLF